MSSKEEDKNKQTSTPTQRRTRKEDKELSKQRAEAKSTGSVTLVSPELSNAKKSKGGNKLDRKERKKKKRRKIRQPY